METCSYTVSMLYNYTNSYAILNYLEYPILLLQEYVLVYFVLKYKGLLELPRTKYYIALYMAFFLVYAFRIAPVWILVAMLPFTTPVSATSKIMQLVAILRTKDSQTISLMTWFISAFTNLSKVFFHQSCLKILKFFCSSSDLHNHAGFKGCHAASKLWSINTAVQLGTFGCLVLQEAEERIV